MSLGGLFQVYPDPKVFSFTRICLDHCPDYEKIKVLILSPRWQSVIQITGESVIVCKKGQKLIKNPVQLFSPKHTQTPQAALPVPATPARTVMDGANAPLAVPLPHGWHPWVLFHPELFPLAPRSSSPSASQPLGSFHTGWPVKTLLFISST